MSYQELVGVVAWLSFFVIPAKAGIQRNTCERSERRIFALCLRGLDPSLRWDDGAFCSHTTTPNWCWDDEKRQLCNNADQIGE